MVEYLSKRKNNTAFCIVDRTNSITDVYNRGLIKNISDFTISNIYSKDYDVFVGLNEDKLIQTVCDLKYEHCVVLSTGTEFINGSVFFNEIEKLINTEYAIYGHILDRKEAYYELHHQCYLLNLNVYREIGEPPLGKEQLGFLHYKTKPLRSDDNIHDDYTPLVVNPGGTKIEYRHKMHGYNLIQYVLDYGYSINSFPESIRNSKKYYYPENTQVFMQQIQFAYARATYCANTFVHEDHTEIIDITDDYEQIITTASGKRFTGPNVIMYDYNKLSLEKYKGNCGQTIHCDLLGIDNHKVIVNTEKKTLLNLNNVFNYEGTAMFHSLRYRLFKENELLNMVPGNWDILFSQRSCLGFYDYSDREIVNVNKLKKPTWHMNEDWE
jgi:hypothetical protein